MGFVPGSRKSQLESRVYFFLHGKTYLPACVEWGWLYHVEVGNVRVFWGLRSFRREEARFFQKLCSLSASSILRGAVSPGGVCTSVVLYMAWGSRTPVIIH